MDAVLAGVGGQFSVRPSEFRVQIQEHHLFFLRRLPHQVIVHQQMLIGQIAGSARLGDHILVQRNQALDINDGVGLAGPDVVNGLAVSIIEALVIIIAQFVDPQR